jgi:hypothetical protein
MNTYETLLYLATEPYDQKITLRDELKSCEAILKELTKEFSSSVNYESVVDTRQANETMVYKN